MFIDGVLFMKRFIALTVMFAFVAASVCFAEEGKKEKQKGEAKPKAEKAVVELKDLVLTGKLTKKEADGKVSYVLTTADGEVMIPAPKAKKDAAAVINLDNFVDQEVTVTGKGMEKEKDGKKKVMVKEVTNIEKKAADEAAPAAPAAE
jgi:hypothetical protein